MSGLPYSLDYETISKRDIPPPPPTQNNYYGLWAALARTIKLLDATEAIRLRVPDDLTVSGSWSSLHSACKAEGVIASTQYCHPFLYIVRAGFVPHYRPQQGIQPRPCRYCGITYQPTRAWQVICGAPQCRKARAAEQDRRYRQQQAGATTKLAASARHGSGK